MAGGDGGGGKDSPPEAIVVETGIPGDRASIVTHGAGRANLAAAAAALREDVGLSFVA